MKQDGPQGEPPRRQKGFTTLVTQAAGRKHLDARWTLCPAGGVDKVWAFVSLFGGNKLHVAALVDYATGHKSNIEKLRRSGLLKAGHVLLATEFCGKDEADIEDLFGEELFLTIVNKAYGIPVTSALKLETLPAGPGLGQRVVQRVEAAMRLVPDVPEFDHFLQSSWVVQNPSAIKMSEHPAALDNFEKLFDTINKLLPR